MTNHSDQLALELAVSGMTLAAPLCDAKGDVLLPEGATLTDAMLAALRRRGIETLSVVVADHTASATAADMAAQHERMRQRIDYLFRRCNSHGASALLKQYLDDFLTGQRV